MNVLIDSGELIWDEKKPKIRLCCMYYTIKNNSHSQKLENTDTLSFVSQEHLPVC